MKLFNQNAEALLWEKAKSLTAQHASWRCIYLNFSSNQENYTQGLRTQLVVNILKKLLGDEEGYIYLCEDGDIFILFQGRVADILEKLGDYFSQWEEGEQQGEELLSLLDLSKHWSMFYGLCKAKTAPRAPAKIIPESKPVPAQPAALVWDGELFVRAQANRPARTRPLVLVVEDDPFTRRLVISTLKANYDVLEAGDCATALHLYALHAPDAAFLDIELPDANGYTVLKQCVAADKAAFIVMLSANSVKEHILASLEEGAQGFVTKPFTKEKLIHYLNMCDTARKMHIKSAKA